MVNTQTDKNSFAVCLHIRLFLFPFIYFLFCFVLFCGGPSCLYLWCVLLRLREMQYLVSYNVLKIDETNA